MSSTSSWLRELEKAKWDSSDVSRARQRGAEGNKIQALHQENFLKRCYRALGSRRARRTFASPPSSSLGAVNTTLLWGAQEFLPSSSGQSGLVLQGEELVWMPGGELGLWICDQPEGQLD